jgi:hypothetical protein
MSAPGGPSGVAATMDGQTLETRDSNIMDKLEDLGYGEDVIDNICGWLDSGLKMLPLRKLIAGIVGDITIFTSGIKTTLPVENATLFGGALLEFLAQNGMSFILQIRGENDKKRCQCSEAVVMINGVCRRVMLCNACTVNNNKQRYAAWCVQLWQCIAY